MNNTPEKNNRLKDAVNSVAVPEYLEARIRGRIRAERRPRLFGFGYLNLAAAGLAGVLFVGAAISYQYGYLRFTKASQISYVWSISNRLVRLMRPGLADHVNCSVFRKYPKNAPAVEVLAQKLPDQYRELIPIVQSRVPPDYRLLISHQCRWDGRKFIHLSIENGSHVLSLVITARKGGESFRAEGLLPALVASDIPMYQSGVQRFAMTAFETKGYIVYFVSDLPQAENSRLMQAMAAPVKDLLGSLEG
ncbi:MAG TPA: hypothetical protein VKB79_01925 [Bryobacteraceae bacterium]|nr:hypothetical protein [Bryobacteraceae bacterium]